MDNMDKILEAFINVARYQPMRGGSYIDLPTKLKNKKAILNIQNRDNECLRWAIRAALFRPRGDMRRTSSYPNEDGLNFTGIDFPTPVSQTEEQIMKMKPNSKKGWILEVDLEYPAHLHDAHNDYPLAPEKKEINPEQMSEYQRRLMADLDLAMPDTEKLVLTLEDKEKYVTHYRNLQFYLRQGMRLKKVHRVIEFDQEPWMEPYIRMNTEFRKQAKNDFETDFYKLMNNSVFGKTMENLRNRVDVKIVRDWENDKIRKLLSSPSFDRFTIFGNDMAGIHMRKTKLVLNKPVYTGMTILENSKILMYNFYYNHLKARYAHKCELVYTDTDSLILDIQTEDVYEDIKEHSWLYDTSNYPKDNPLYDNRNKKVLGKMKDECGGLAIEEVVAIRPKMYSVLKEGKKNEKKAKGVKKKCDRERDNARELQRSAL